MQKMGELKTERFVKSKPFTNILVDCLGSFTAFDAVKKRTTGKVWLRSSPVAIVELSG